MISSVINALEKTSDTDNDYSKSHALVTAYIHRSNLELLKLEQSQKQESDEEIIKNALSFCNKAIQTIDNDDIMYDTMIKGRVWKVYANINELDGNYKDAIYGYKMLGMIDSSYNSKAQSEINRLSKLCNDV